jgi:hypothetical protein
MRIKQIHYTHRSFAVARDFFLVTRSYNKLRGPSETNRQSN